VRHLHSELCEWVLTPRDQRWARPRASRPLTSHSKL
jgi:hypothetical protein